MPKAFLDRFGSLGAPTADWEGFQRCRGVCADGSTCWDSVRVVKDMALMASLFIEESEAVGIESHRDANG